VTTDARCLLDKVKEIEVKTQQGQNLAAENNWLFAEVSNENGQGVDQLFQAITEKIVAMGG